MVISIDLQQFCVLECPGCKQKKHTKDRKPFDCPRCQQRTTLVPRCTFQINLIDGSGSVTIFISGDIVEKLLSMTTENIFETTCVKHQLLPINHVQQLLLNKLFRVQLKKSSWTSSNITHTSVTILSYTEKEQHLLPSIDDRNAKKVKPLGTGELKIKDRDVESESSRADISIEMPSPSAKKDKSFDKDKVQMKATIVECESSSAIASIKPPTLAKKM